MPTYEYVCHDCGYEFEKFQRMTEDHLTTCPHCHQNTLKRKIGTGAGIIFKGSGFYQTDYKGANASLPPPHHHHHADAAEPCSAAAKPCAPCACGGAEKKTAC